MFKAIVNSQIELELLHEKHAEKLFQLIDANREHLSKWLPWVKSANKLEDTLAFINHCNNQYVLNNGFQAIIFFNRQIAGIIGLHNIDWANKKTSIGYWIGKEFEGNGIITLCCQKLIDYLFNELQLNRIEIRCATENTKSAAIPERLGFSFEGIFRQTEWLYDHFVDHKVYSLLRND